MKIVILDASTLGEGLDLNIFDRFGEVIIYDYTEDDVLLERIIDADVVITNKINLTKEMNVAKNLKLICLTATGTNNIDLELADQFGIRVTNIVGYSTHSVAQHTFAMLLYLMEKLAYYNEYVESGNYVDDTDFTHYKTSFHDLTNKTFGIIGLGNIGKKVATIAEAFGAKVIYYSTSGRNNDQTYKMVDLETLLKTADVVSVHAPLNEQTNKLINKENIRLIKPTSYLLNLGRGDVVDEAALADVILNESIAGVGVDVLSIEPMAQDCPLRAVMDSPRLLITPHIAWASIESRTRAMEEVAQNIQAYIGGERRNCVGKH